MAVSNAPTDRCPGCGALCPPTDGPTHRYIGASPGCWAGYGRLLAGEYPYSRSRRAALVVDAYAAQHPGQDVPPARQSVAVHLVALHACLHEGLDSARLNRIRVAGAEWGHVNGFEWLEPMPHWRVTLSDVIDADGPTARGAALDRYIGHVYEAWMDGHGAAVRRWHEHVIGALHRSAPRRGH